MELSIYHRIMFVLILLSGLTLLFSREASRVAIISLLIVLLVHATRKDKLFVNTYFKHPRLLHSLDYLLICLPSLIMLLMNKQFTIAAIIFALASLWSFIPANNSSLLNIALPKQANLSVLSGLRELLPILAIMYLVLLAVCTWAEQPKVAIYFYLAFVSIFSFVGINGLQDIYIRMYQSPQSLIKKNTSAALITTAQVALICSVPVLSRGLYADFAVVSIGGFLLLATNIYASIIFSHLILRLLIIMLLIFLLSLALVNAVLGGFLLLMFLVFGLWCFYILKRRFVW